MYSIVAAVVVQLVRKDGDVPTSYGSFRPLWVFIEPYVQLIISTIHFRVVSPRLNGIMTLKQQKTLFKAGPPLLEPDIVRAAAWDLSPDVDDANQISCNEASCGKPTGHADYAQHDMFATNHPWFTNTMNNVRRVPPRSEFLVHSLTVAFLDIAKAGLQLSK